MPDQDSARCYIVRAEWIVDNKPVPAIASVALNSLGSLVIGTDEGTFKLAAAAISFNPHGEWPPHGINLTVDLPDTLKGRPVFAASTPKGRLLLDACPLMGLCAEAAIDWRSITQDIDIEVQPPHMKPRWFVGSITFDPATNRVIAAINAKDMMALPLESLRGIATMARRENFSLATIILPRVIYRMPLPAVVEFLDDIDMAMEL